MVDRPFVVVRKAHGSSSAGSANARKFAAVRVTDSRYKFSGETYNAAAGAIEHTRLDVCFSDADVRNHA